MLASTLYLVRVWQQADRDGRPAFRASVRAVDAERETLFTRPADLARYLANANPSTAERLPGAPDPSY